MVILAHTSSKVIACVSQKSWSPVRLSAVKDTLASREVTAQLDGSQIQVLK